MRGPSAWRCSARALAPVLQLVAVVLVLGGCVPAPPTTGTGPAVGPTAPVDRSAADDPVVSSGALQATRAVLADPAAAVAQGALDVARRVDAVRFEVPRGAAQADAAQQARARADALLVATDDLDVAATRVDADLRPAGQAATALAALGRDVAEAARADLDDLAPLTAHDIAVDAVIAGWATPGSRSEIVAQFDPLVAQADALEVQARQLRRSPPACDGLRANRVAWADLVAERTAELRAVAASFDGPRFDELEARYRRAPRGEDPVVADAEARPCWARHSPIAGVPDRVADQVRQLEVALSR